ncbi:MAG: M1 family metallopeptidase [Patescibacteria group bacterium]
MKKDPHSYYEPGQPKTENLSWTILSFDFEKKSLHGKALYAFDGSGETNFDTRELEIIRVGDSEGEAIPFELAEHHAVKGSRLTFTVPANREVEIEYRTTPPASGLQWMSAELAGGHPFVYTQGQTTNARSYIPCQDTPSIKFPFEASLTVPAELRGLVAAAEHVGRVENQDGSATESWNMPYPIASYLLAFAVGDLVSEDISDRSRVWAQPPMIQAAAQEFKDIPLLMEAGEKLFGPYPFGRYDVLVMPSAFPYGGMENPCLTFVTPALVAGDGSGIGVIAHELAHSWTGNLVTNSDWDGFWLNEGWTTWAEGRILEVVYGKDHAMLHQKLLESEFLIDCAHFAAEGNPHYMKLTPGAHDVDPDEIFSRVPYFKGSQFVRLLEETVGRERFDAFVGSYIDAHKYQSIDTDTLLAFIETELGKEVLDTVRAHDWVHGHGIPDNQPPIETALIDQVRELAQVTELPGEDAAWSNPQWQLYLELLPRPLSPEFVADLERRFSLSQIPNVEVKWSFLVASAQAGHVDLYPAVESFLRTQGRIKYLKPLYEALASTEQGSEHATRIFSDAKGNYHPAAISAVERTLK